MNNEPLNLEIVGIRLQQWRKKNKLTLVQLSKKTNVSQGSLSDLENGNSLPSAQTLANLHRSTNMDIIWLLTGK